MRVITIDPEGAVGLAVAAAVEPPAGDLARRRLDGRDAAQVRPRRFRAQPLGVVAGGDEQGGGGVDADAVHLEQAGRGRGDERCEQRVDGGEFSSSRASTRRPRMRMAVLVAVMTGSPPGRGRSAAATPPRWSRLTPAQSIPQLVGRGEAEVADLVERLDPASSGRERLATTRARMASTLPSRVLPAPWARPDSAARAASTASAGSDLPVRRRAWRLGRSTSTTATPTARSERARLAP